ncbi:uncharacterized protein LOC113317939 [Papaver somniferum]|uniref:uncharacterized protein LOC113317939 n=1 Tax=Papaver somniferum TaxID=3469 RepID=UPI000E702D17|nr:uncharacterized protein LOC113317939 [Papaver somniferum]
MRLSIYSACHLLQWLLPRQERKGNKKELLMPRMRVQTAAEATRQMLTKKKNNKEWLSLLKIVIADSNDAFWEDTTCETLMKRWKKYGMRMIWEKTNTKRCCIK